MRRSSQPPVLTKASLTHREALHLKTTSKTSQLEVRCPICLDSVCFYTILQGTLAYLPVQNVKSSLSMFEGDKLVPGARDVLTDIFKSCVHSEQMLSLTPAKPVKVSDIYLSKEQINSQTPGNLLHIFFTNVRPPKKVLEDQLTQVLHKKYSYIHIRYRPGNKLFHPPATVAGQIEC